MEGFITQASNFVWSPALVALCLLGGLWFSVRGRFLQLRLIGEMIRLLFQKKVGEVGISSFQALGRRYGHLFWRSGRAFLDVGCGLPRGVIRLC